MILLTTLPNTPVSHPIDWPAWITAGAACVGIPLSLISVIKLVRRDQDKQEQLDKLTRIAAVLENQNDIMVKHNDLVAQQVDVLRNSLILKGNDGDAMTKLQAIEEQKLRLSVQPRLWLNGATYFGGSGELRIDLNNKGEVAVIDDFIMVSGELTLHNKSVPYDLEKGERRYIFARANGGLHIKDTEYEIEVLYHNTLMQPYRALIKGKGASVKIIVDEPI